MMKRFVLIVLVALIAFGCEKKNVATNDGKVKILASFAPMWIVTANVIKGVPGVELDVLLPPKGAGPHDYQLTPGDMRKLAEADVIVLNGLGIESFLGDSISKANQHAVVITASDGITPLPDSPHDREIEGDGNENHDHGANNPHVWVSPLNAATEARNIAESLAKRDPANAATYRANAAAYADELTKLDNDFKATVAAMKNVNIVTIHNAFDYLAADTGLKVVAVLKVDANIEPRAAELAAISDRIKSAGVIGIFTEPQFSDRMANVLSQETGAPVYRLDPVDTGELRAEYYIEVMRKNLETLKIAGGTR